MNYSRELDKEIDLWIVEDIGGGDHTTFSTIPESAIGKARLLVKQQGLLAGVEVAKKIFKRFDNNLDMTQYMGDGESIKPGDIAFKIEGAVRSILQCERIVLNVMQRMSGIATLTSEYVRLVEGTGVGILDTRKTTPGFRVIEKEAVLIGGGMNHRFGLYDMILIKDNHIDFAGGIENAINNTRSYLASRNLDIKVEIETRSLADIDIVLKNGGVDRILLDNFTPELTLKAVKQINRAVETESSGGITKENIRKYAETGVDFISVGALTHQIKSLDLSLKAEF